MSDQGRLIQDCVSNLITLYRQIQALLLSAEGEFVHAGWVPFNRYTVSHSKTIDVPDKWLAQYAYRFYGTRDADKGHLLLYVAALLFNSDNPEQLTEPVITAGWMEYRKPVKLEHFLYEDAYLHLNNPGASNDGSVTSHDTASMPKESRRFSRFGTLAVPLVEISSSAELNCRVVAPLLERVELAAKEMSANARPIDLS